MQTATWAEAQRAGIDFDHQIYAAGERHQGCCWSLADVAEHDRGAALRMNRVLDHCERQYPGEPMSSRSAFIDALYGVATEQASDVAAVADLDVRAREIRLTLAPSDRCACGETFQHAAGCPDDLTDECKPERPSFQSAPGNVSQPAKSVRS
jgi:hypothetical protein